MTWGTFLAEDSLDAPGMLTRDEAWELAGAAATTVGQFRLCSHYCPPQYGLSTRDLREEPPKLMRLPGGFFRQRTERKAPRTPHTPEEFARAEKRREYHRKYREQRKEEERKEREQNERRERLYAKQDTADRERRQAANLYWEQAFERQRQAVELMKQKRAAFYQMCADEARKLNEQEQQHD